MDELPHFSRSELACPGSGKMLLAPDFGETLERLRVDLDAPMHITSACRSPKYNSEIRGHPRSLHLTTNAHWDTGGTCAVDIAMVDGEFRADLIALALEQGWSIGVASNFIHLDQRSRYCGLVQVVYHYKR